MKFPSRLKNLFMAPAFCVAIVFSLFTAQPVYAEELVVIVNQSNQIQNITTEKIKKMFSGQTRFWKNGERIAPYHLAKGSAEKEVFLHSVFEQTPRAHGRYWLLQKQLSGETEPSNLTEDSEMAWVVSRNKYAIGYLSRSSFEALSQRRRNGIRPILRIRKR